jgi:hypothetical protein
MTTSKHTDYNDRQMDNALQDVYLRMNRGHLNRSEAERKVNCLVLRAGNDKQLEMIRRFKRIHLSH